LRFTEAHFRVKAVMVRLRQKVWSRNRGGPAGRRAGLEDVEKLRTNTIDAANKMALGVVK
jgi:hypothetical protein